MYNKKKVIIVTMCIFILLMITGYAVFSSNLKINGTASIETTWEVLFTKIEKINVIGKASELSTPIANGTTASFQVGLTKPGDGIEYKITVSNRGDFDAVIESIEALERGNDAVKFEIKNIKKGDKLLKKSSTTFNIKVYFDESITDHPGKVENNLTIGMKCSQDVGQNVPGETPIIKSTKLATRILQDNVAVSDTSIDFSKISSDTNGKGLYYTEKNTEGNKRTYYFRGAVENNYVSFAGHIWRIVRINEDGSIRLMKNDNIGRSAFNVHMGDNAFVGYMYGTPITYIDGSMDYSGWVWIESLGTIKMSKNYSFNSSTGEYTLTSPIVDGYYSEDYYNYYTCMSSTSSKCLFMVKLTQARKNGNSYQMLAGETHAGYFSKSYEQAHKNEVNSTIKTYLDNWYQNNLLSYSSYIADSGFCNDRSLSTFDVSEGFGQHGAYYGSTYRNWRQREPQFKCPNESRDLFTTSTSNKGNRALKYPIGLITVDELAYAGGVYGTANNCYLNTGKVYYTMSPFRLYGLRTDGWLVVSNGTLTTDRVDGELYTFPTINLASTVEITKGTGTSSSPYVIKTN